PRSSLLSPYTTLFRSRDGDVAPGIRQPPLDQSLRPGRDTELCQGRQLLGAGDRSQETAGGQRTHHEHTETHLLGQRQDPLLDLALPRVVRDLDLLDAPR